MDAVPVRGTSDAVSEITLGELQIAERNHSLPLEALRHPVTPLGLHYQLIHFDIPLLDQEAWRLTVDGCVERALSLTLDDLRTRPVRTEIVTMECAGNGRSLMSPRPVGMPWLLGAVGTAEWTGTPLRPLLLEAGVRPNAIEVVFHGHDRGSFEDGEHAYARSLALADALSDDVLVAYAVNGQLLPPQHGFPARLIVPGWYGMASVKWLRTITIVDEPFCGIHQEVGYRIRQTPEDVGEPVTRMLPRALMAPPGIPDVFRARFVTAGVTLLEGRAWSGMAPIVRVEVSTDGGATWEPATLDEPVSEHAWCGWGSTWIAEPGETELRCRATDAAGNTQPDESVWNLDGYCNNIVQRIPVTVTP